MPPKKGAGKKSGASTSAVSPFSTPRPGTPVATLSRFSEFPIWSEQDIPTLEKAVAQPFSDTQNASLLPASDVVKEWVRAPKVFPEKGWVPVNGRDIYPISAPASAEDEEEADALPFNERPNVPMLECCAAGIDALPVISTISTCISTGGYLLEKADFGHLIFPQNEAGLPVASAGGKHWVKLFCMGEWRRVEIDDALPVDSTGRVLFPRTCIPIEPEEVPENGEGEEGDKEGEGEGSRPETAQPSLQNEYWACLIAKALLKLLGGNFDVAGRDVVSLWVHALTGYAPLCSGLGGSSYDILHKLEHSKMFAGSPLALCIKPGKMVHTRVEVPEGSEVEEGRAIEGEESEAQEEIQSEPSSAFEGLANSHAVLASIEEGSKFNDFTTGHTIGYTLHVPKQPAEGDASKAGAKGKAGGKDKKGGAAAPAAPAVSAEALEAALTADEEKGLVGTKTFHIDLIARDLLETVTFFAPSDFHSNRKYVHKEGDGEQKDTLFCHFQSKQKLLLVASSFERDAEIEMVEWDWTTPLEQKPLTTLKLSGVVTTEIKVQPGERVFKVRGKNVSSFSVIIYTTDERALLRSAVATPELSFEDSSAQIAKQEEARKEREEIELGSFSFNTESKVVKERQHCFVLDAKGEYDALDAQRWSVIFRRSVNVEEPTFVSFHVSFSSSHLCEHADLYLVDNKNGKTVFLPSLVCPPIHIVPSEQGYTLLATTTPRKPFNPGTWNVRCFSAKVVKTAAEPMKPAVDQTGEYADNFFKYLFRLNLSVNERSVVAARVCFPTDGDRQEGPFLLGNEQPRLRLEVVEDGNVVATAESRGAVVMGGLVVDAAAKGAEKKVILQCSLLQDEGGEGESTSAEASAEKSESPRLIANESSVVQTPDGKQWSLRMFANGVATLKPNTDLEDHYTAVKQGWEKAQPGRAAKGKQSRTKFTENPSMIVEQQAQESARASVVDKKGGKGKGGKAKEAAPVNRDEPPAFKVVSSDPASRKEVDKEQEKERREKLKAKLAESRKARVEDEEGLKLADGLIEETRNARDALH
uniref:FAP42-like domain-containing protein n=1 Tax=Palpitomonas bilix TaxID=652834 RepID=A0A7S3LWV5_9EUKA|mmetsp:Transcript_796/g.1437  ORF Transcript_796/g.1437 Transcript_796/m.1437 type:complete len:1040 (+) Transcript_796:124-3243(+)